MTETEVQSGLRSLPGMEAFFLEAGMDRFPRVERLLSLGGRAAIITGAAAGIGRAVANRFAEAGARLFLLDVNQEKLEEAREELGKTFGQEVNIFRIDLGDKDQIDAFWAALSDPVPDILINNAGIFPFRRFEDLDEGLYRKVMQVNLDAMVWMCRHFIRRRWKQGGIIVNVASIEAVLPFMEGLAHYSTSKAGVIALTRALAREYGPRGFRVNAIVPGGVVTRGFREVMREILRFRLHFLIAGRRFMARLPLRRFAHPDEVARMILVLSSDAASYVHGAVIPVDGGFLSA